MLSGMSTTGPHALHGPILTYALTKLKPCCYITCKRVGSHYGLKHYSSVGSTLTPLLLLVNMSCHIVICAHGKSIRCAHRATTASVAEAKDGELERVLASNARLRQDLASTQQARMVSCPCHLLMCISSPAVPSCNNVVCALCLACSNTDHVHCIPLTQVRNSEVMTVNR